LTAWQPVSCITQVGRAAGKQITTIEVSTETASCIRLQEAFIKADAMQCAYCTSGMIMSASALLSKNPKPNREDIISGMNGNICRCGTYQRIGRCDSNCLGPGDRCKGGDAMIEEQSLLDEIESERYELFESPNYNFHFARRDFIKAVRTRHRLHRSRRARARTTTRPGRIGRGGNERLPNDIDAWIHIKRGRGVTVFTGKVEVGQNTRTTLSQSVADELHVPIDSVHLVMGDTDLTPFDMGTFGSRSTQLWRRSCAKPPPPRVKC